MHNDEIYIPPNFRLVPEEDTVLLFAKRKAALAYLKQKWLLHPANSPKSKT